MTAWAKQIIDYKKNTLDQISPSFCSAKWSQVTIHLGLGHTHSCHHPKTHVIPIEEIKRDPSALHNTNQKKLARAQMMTGERPSECDYCWRVEDSGQVLSDRVLKSHEPWSRNMLDQIIQAGYTKSINPSYLEVSFSNVCNFKCSYCSPDVSSKWMEEIKQFGAYPTSRQFNNLAHIKEQDKMPLLESEDNPYVDAFWTWWPELYPTLHTFRITGGEPLMSKHTFRVLDYIIANPNRQLELAINSNLCVPVKLIDKFIAKLKLVKKCVKAVKVYTSCEAYGAQAEYIRHGMNYSEWYDNCQRVLSETRDVPLLIMSTYNALSVTSYQEFLEDMLKLKKMQGKVTWYHKLFKFKYGKHRVHLDIPYLNNPLHQNLAILTPDYLDLIRQQIEFMKSHEEFYPSEVQKLERVLGVFEPKLLGADLMQNINRKDFVKFVDEHDRRRATNFSSTFPQMMEFYNMCKELK
jgi:organic radical activating enzyme